MLDIFFVITVAIPFTTKFAGQTTNYYLRLLMGIIWISLWLGVEFIKDGKITIPRALSRLVIPWLVIVVWTVIAWVIQPPVGLNTKYVSRMVSNTIYIVVAVLNAYSGIYFFKEKAVKLSLYAILTTIALNFVKTVQIYGMANIITYLKTFLFEEYPMESTLGYVASMLEVQGPTMALGMYLVYYLCFHKEEKKYKKVATLIMICCGLYLGFKRVVLLGAMAVVGVLWFLKSKSINTKRAINYVSLIISCVLFGYVVIVKSDLITTISELFNVDMMGRDNIYRWVSELFDLLPIYLGKGFCYISKYMYDTTGFEAHSEALRMYIELGFIPYFIWLWYYLNYIPKSILRRYGDEAAKICMGLTVFVFTTFLVENTLVLYPMEYSLALFTMLYMAKQEDSSKNIYISSKSIQN